MTKNDTFLEDIQDNLNQIAKPYQADINQRQKKADLIKSCIQCAKKDDFLRLDELLKSKIAHDVEADGDFENCSDMFASLREYADGKVERYRIQLIDDLTRSCSEAGLDIQMDFPRFSVLKGINGEIDFSGRCTVINKKVLKSIDPRRIATALQKLKRQLYDRSYDPQQFIDALYKTYAGILKKEKLASGEVVSIQQFYLEHVISLQSKVFFLNMDKGKFKGYSLEQFSVDLWCYFEAGINGTSDGHELQLRPGRNKSLWLLDSQGEERQITGISFQKHKGKR